MIIQALLHFFESCHLHFDGAKFLEVGSNLRMKAQGLKEVIVLEQSHLQEGYQTLVIGLSFHLLLNSVKPRQIGVLVLLRLLLGEYV